jgi:hypothetical protein
MNKFNNTLKRSQVVLILTRQPILMTKMLNKLDIGGQILQNLFLLDLQKRIDARREKHISSVGLTVRTRFLQHY